MKMEQTECSKTLAYKIQMPGNYPEESIEQRSTLMWNKKPTRYHLVLYLFLLYKLLNMFRATLCPSSVADDLVVFFHVWCSAVAVWAVRSGWLVVCPLGNT